MPAIYSSRVWKFCPSYIRNVTLCQKTYKENEGLLYTNPFYLPSKYYKYMLRLSIPSRYCCEEMSLILTARIECNIHSYHLTIPFKSYHRDNNSRMLDKGVKQINALAREEDQKKKSFMFYLKNGLLIDY